MLILCKPQIHWLWSTLSSFCQLYSKF